MSDQTAAIQTAAILSFFHMGALPYRKRLKIAAVGRGAKP